MPTDEDGYEDWFADDDGFKPTAEEIGAANAQFNADPQARLRAARAIARALADDPDAVSTYVQRTYCHASQHVLLMARAYAAYMDDDVVAIGPRDAALLVALKSIEHNVWNDFNPANVLGEIILAWYNGEDMLYPKLISKGWLHG